MVGVVVLLVRPQSASFQHLVVMLRDKERRKGERESEREREFTSNQIGALNKVWEGERDEKVETGKSVVVLKRVLRKNGHLFAKLRWR